MIASAENSAAANSALVGGMNEARAGAVGQSIAANAAVTTPA
jgi:hypothetical protein